MASPLIESRIEPHKKAHFNLHISERVSGSDAAQGIFSSVKFNHKPAQTSDSRKTTLTSTSTDAYNLRLEDSNKAGSKDVFTFKGGRSASKKSYVLLFDSATQQATLEPLSASYTFNLATRNNKDVSSQHAKIHSTKGKDDVQDAADEDDLFGETVGDDVSGDPDPNNPFDVRHFLSKDKERRGDESDFASSPDQRGGDTPQLGARKPAVASVAKAKAKAAEPAPKKRRAAEVDPFMKKKTGAKKAQPTPSIHLERRASERPVPDVAPKPRGKAAGPPASKIKSAELVHSSDDSDIDADGEAEPVSSPPRRASPSPQRPQTYDPEDEDAEGESDDDGGLEIEVPDARPARPRNNGALASLGLGQNLGVGGGFKSPSNGPISLASATSSAQGSPSPHGYAARRNGTMQDDTVIDFGDLGDDAEEEEGEEDEDDDNTGGIEIEDGDPDEDDDIDTALPPRQSAAGHDRKPSTAAAPAEEDEEDPLYQEMMAGLAGGDSSEESEEE